MVTHTVKLTLSPTQVKRREKILAATREIIANTGSDALNMQDVADKAGITRATIYRYYASKDDLINDMALEWGLSLGERLQLMVPPGNTTSFPTG